MLKKNIIFFSYKKIRHLNKLLRLCIKGLCDLKNDSYYKNLQKNTLTFHVKKKNQKSTSE